MLFRILGVLEVRTDEGWSGIGAQKWRALLAALLLRRGQVVPTDILVDELWGDDPPPAAHKLVSGYVSRLRRLIGDPAGQVLVTRAPGYQLRASRDDVDASRFDDLVSDARRALHDADVQRGAALLSEALGLWRGPALADVPLGPLASAESVRLAELRLDALELRIETDLARGRGGEVIAELRRLTAEHPLRERLWGQLMRALYGHGLSADALEVYARAHQVIAEELGADPGPELQELHRRILLGDPTLAARLPGDTDLPGAGPVLSAPAATPRQLPAAPRPFVDRQAELARLSTLLDEVADAERATVIAAVVGGPGVGKTTLALHWSGQVADRFADGQLYVNLRGYDESQHPVRPAEAILHFLDALGVPPERVPAAPEAQAGLYRSLMAGRRMLIVLDNARDDAQVRPLLPGSQDCMVLVTSRSELAGLAATAGAHMFTLGVLTSAEAREMLTRRLGQERAAAEPAAVDELAELCARLPLALSIAAGRVVARPGLHLAALAAGLRDSRSRLDELDTGDASASIRAAFSWSYQQLSEPAAGMFQLVGIHPGPDITAPAAASTAGVDLPAAREALRDLARAHLVSEHLPGRYSFHGLLRAYAAEQARAHGSEDSLRAAQDRAGDHYLHTARAAGAILYPDARWQDPGPPRAGVTPERLASRAEAENWYRAEHQTLLAVIAQPAHGAAHRQARLLAVIAADILTRQGLWPSLPPAERAILAAALQAP